MFFVMCLIFITSRGEFMSIILLNKRKKNVWNFNLNIKTSLENIQSNALINLKKF